MMFDFFSSYYYLVIILQGICVFHCVKKGNQNKWIWLIVFLPVIGGLIYIFSEILTKKDVSNVQTNIATVINPGGRIKKLKQRLEFTNTFENKVALADAYLDSGMTQEASELYESCLVGIFSDNEYVIRKLIEAYYIFERYEDVVKLAGKIYHTSEFPKSRAHILMGLSLEKIGRTQEAEKELKMIRGKYSNFEGRFQYGQFLIRAGRSGETKEIYTEIMEEATHMSSGESRNSREWFRKTREELTRLN